LHEVAILNAFGRLDRFQRVVDAGGPAPLRPRVLLELRNQPRLIPRDIEAAAAGGVDVLVEGIESLRKERDGIERQLSAIHGISQPPERRSAARCSKSEE
jgi:hypothetical protein